MSIYDALPAQETMDGVWRAVVAKAPANASSPIEVTIKSFDTTFRWGPCAWLSRGLSLPQRGDPCYVVFDEKQQPLVLVAVGGPIGSGGGAAGLLLGRDIQWNEGSTPPSSPVVNDLWLFHPVAGTSWTFRYEPDQDATYPWQLIGGPPHTAYNDSAASTSSTTPVAVGPSITCARAGIYNVGWGGRLYATNPAPGNVTLHPYINGVQPGPHIDHYQGQAGTFTTTLATNPMRKYNFTVGAGNVIDLRMAAVFGGQTAYSDNRWLEVIPLRIA
jgi:hypothetical protein